MSAKGIVAKKIVAIDITEGKIDAARQFGATDWVNPKTVPDEISLPRPNQLNDMMGISRKINISFPDFIDEGLMTAIQQYKPPLPAKLLSVSFFSPDDRPALPDSTNATVFANGTLFIESFEKSDIGTYSSPDLMPKMYANGKWNDYFCDRKKRFVCKK
ncbi:hypothetical protein TELCIR_05767 [Teladorsagia circumcincta]|uniref:Alcohol dehydrogenase-like C-terminal domain-containing protein n=1 Tax=Teladorsagia circumcincta TaxID=45464 RepID=A0A2G9UPY1_TELCI|nr:hypothetical protein TELCIR_05767 [Teladorsagia circumcincta]